MYIPRGFFKRLTLVFFLGFSSGLPFALTGTTLQAWFSYSGLSIVAIGYLSLIGQPYLYKFLWAPFLDRYWFAKVGRRRGWICVFQLLLVILLIVLSQLDPVKMVRTMFVVALLIAFLSASQDVVIDAYRAEVLLDNERGLGGTLSVLAYRLAAILSGGVALILAGSLGFSKTYLIMSLCFIPSILVNFMISETSALSNEAPTKVGFFEPFRQLLLRKKGALCLMFLFLYKLGEAFTSTTSGISQHYLLSGLHFSLATVGYINKGLGMVATIGGGLLAGFLMLRLRLFAALFIFGVLQVIANLSFVYLAMVGKNINVLSWAVFIDNLAAGMGMTALIALMMALCERKFTATQFALYSAVASLPRVLAGPISAILQPKLGWLGFYWFSSVIAIPALGILWIIRDIDAFGTEGGTRTHTMLPSSDFESDASTSSATSAKVK